MKKLLTILIIGILAVSILDTLGAIASRQLNFSYSWLSIASIIIYIGFAFFLARQTDKKMTIILTGLLGLFDATIGWKLSSLLGANKGGNHIEIKITTLVIIAIVMTIFTSSIGLLGWWLSHKFTKKMTIKEGGK